MKEQKSKQINTWSHVHKYMHIPKQGYNNAKFEKPCLNSVHEKNNNEVFVKSGNTSIILFEYDCVKVQICGKFMIYLTYRTIL